MSDKRPAIPKEIERAVFVEAGHRCAIPTCKTSSPLEIAHIEPYSRIKKHNFDNLICLCTNCHTRFDKGQDGFDRKSMKIYKQNLSQIKGMYSDFENIIFERMILENADSIVLDDFYEPFLFYSLRDRILIKGESKSGNKINGILIGPFEYTLSKTGKDFLKAIKLGKNLN